MMVQFTFVTDSLQKEIEQLRNLEEEFLKEGGLHERMTRARINERNKGQQGHK